MKITQEVKDFCNELQSICRAHEYCVNCPFLDEGCFNGFENITKIVEMYEKPTYEEELTKRLKSAFPDISDEAIENITQSTCPSSFFTGADNPCGENDTECKVCWNRKYEKRLD